MRRIALVVAAAAAPTLAIVMPGSARSAYAQQGGRDFDGGGRVAKLIERR